MHITKFQKSTVLFVLITVLALLVFQDGVRMMATWDLFGHYIYLPLIFDQHQIVLTDLNYPNFLDETYNLTETLYQFVQSDQGTFYTRYSGGWAILQLPFYIIAECWAYLSGHNTDGFSYPYQFMIQIGTLFYATLGFWMTLKVLLNYFSFRRSILLLTLLLLGTNMLFMLFATPATSHIFSFCILSCLVYALIQFSKKQSIRGAILLGFLWGLLALIRPPDALFGILFLLWDSNKRGGVIASARWWLKENRKLTIALFIIFIATCFPQFLYWKLNVGSWIINSYGHTPNEGFDWFNPHTIDFLFSFRKGWFVYTPLMVFAFIGFYKGFRREVNVKWMLFTTLLFLYLISSWSCWWYAASFGSRAAVDMYVLLIIGIGFFLDSLKSTWIKIVTGFIFTSFVVLNVFQAWQMMRGILHVERMSKAYYCSVIGQTTMPTSEQSELLLVDRNALIVNGLKDTLGLKRFDLYIDELEEAPITSEAMYGPGIVLPVIDLIREPYTWLKVTFQVKDTTGLYGTIFMVNGEHNDKPFCWAGYEFGSPMVDYSAKKQTLSFSYLLPEFRFEEDSLSIGIWKRFGNPLVLKSRKLEFFTPFEK